MKICTKARAAKLLKVSRATIYAMIKRGELMPNDQGYVDLDQLPPADYSKPGRKRTEKNAVGKTVAPQEASPQVTTDHIADLEKTIDSLRRELEKTRQQLAKERDRKSHRLLLQEGALLMRDSTPASPTATRTSNSVKSMDALREKHISFLEQENARLRAENQALRSSVGQAVDKGYFVTTVSEGKFRPYDPAGRDLEVDEDLEKEFGTQTWQKKPTEERLPLN
jgi:transposase